jgi:anti-sigma B factor antagonist
MSLQCVEKEVGDISVFRLSGRVTLGDGTTAIRKAIRDALARGRKNILLNFEDVFFVDSSGLGELVTAQTMVRKAGGKLKLTNLRENARDLIHTTRLYTVLEAFPDESLALQSFGGA